MKVPLKSTLQRIARRVSSFAPEMVTLSVELVDLRTMMAVDSDRLFGLTKCGISLCGWFEGAGERVDEGKWKVFEGY